jgi:hypothetical protein
MEKRKPKFKKKNTYWLGQGGLIQLFNAKFLSNYITFTSTKKMKLKYIFTS